MNKFLSVLISGSDFHIHLFGFGFAVTLAIALHKPGFTTAACAVWNGFLHFANLYSQDYQSRQARDQGEEQ